jgi:hypothetical protein
MNFKIQTINPMTNDRCAVASNDQSHIEWSLHNCPQTTTLDVRTIEHSHHAIKFLHLSLLERAWETFIFIFMPLTSILPSPCLKKKFIKKKKRLRERQRERERERMRILKVLPSKEITPCLNLIFIFCYKYISMMFSYCLGCLSLVY